MKKLGLIGGLGPASTVDYYVGLIEKHRAAHGEDQYPEIVIDSVNMHDIIEAFGKDDLDAVAAILLKSFGCLKAAGADVAAICSNTPHIVWDKFIQKSPLPIISIIDASVQAMIDNGYNRIIVFGTEFTMSSGLYDRAMSEACLTPIVPHPQDIKILGSLIYPNLENGIVIPADKERMIAIAEKYIKQENADALLLGCTEIPLMIKPGDVSVPILDTTKIHIDALYKAL